MPLARAPLLRSATTVFLATVVVSVVNYLRDSWVVSALGAGAASDAFFSALLVPTILAQALIPGVLTAALLPVYEGLRHDREVAARLLGTVAVAVAAVGVTAVVPMGLWTPRLVGWLLPGFGPDATALTVEALRWMLAAVPLLALGVLARTALQAHERFLAAALTPGLTGIAVLAALLAGSRSVRWLAVAAAAGMAAQLVVLTTVLVRSRIPVRLPRPGGSLGVTGLPEVGTLAIPLALAAAAGFVPTVIERWWASHLAAGTVAHVTLVQRLVGLPVVLVGSSVSTVLFPRLAAAATAGSRERYSRALSEGISLALPPLLLCAAWLIGAADTVVALLYRHGAFSTADAAATAALLRSYAWGLPASSLWVVLVKGLTARRDPWSHTLLIVALIPLDLALMAVLVPRFGPLGLGHSFALTTWLGIGMQAAVLGSRHGAVGVTRLARQVVAWLPATAAAVLAAGALDATAGGAGLGATELLARLAAAGLAGGVTFLLAARLTGRWGQVRELLRLFSGSFGGGGGPSPGTDTEQAGDDQ